MKKVENYKTKKQATTFRLEKMAAKEVVLFLSQMTGSVSNEIFIIEAKPYQTRPHHTTPYRIAPHQTTPHKFIVT
ncbi:hypothetical protein [Pontibacillus sp. HMF3514]|uniref:hypothetical protein n=1 Tax=Pontibacillus sp. HMF3514 TaxID=2692425 RepID=UPI00131FBE92|nr:hypothetical protein [Pontibacillus sp. HMF3514]QHE52790.1 hypothetical protein GS400_12475 [Pontibacillus sp. HMF3514]